MARAKADSTLTSELFTPRIYKPNQGRVVRQVTAVAVAIVFVATAWRLRAAVLIDQAPGLATGIPAAIAVLGVWFAFRLVNWPVFANFLVSVEAELDKVTWADWTYLKRATAVVITTMFVLGIYLFLCDVVWQQLFGYIGFLDLDALGD